MKHEKDRYVKFIDEICDDEDVNEYSLHHEFSPLRTEKDEKDIKVIKEYINTRCDLTKPGPLINMFSGNVLTDEKRSFLLNCIENGENQYKQYREDRLVKKTSNLFDTISLNQDNKKKKKCENPDQIQKTHHAEFARAIDVSRARGYSVKKLLSYDKISNSYRKL